MKIICNFVIAKQKCFWCSFGWRGWSCWWGQWWCYSWWRNMMMMKSLCSLEFAHTSRQVFLLVTIHLGRRRPNASLMMMVMINNDDGDDDDQNMEQGMSYTWHVPMSSQKERMLFLSKKNCWWTSFEIWKLGCMKMWEWNVKKCLSENV